MNMYVWEYVWMCKYGGTCQWVNVCQITLCAMTWPFGVAMWMREVELEL